MKFDMYVKNIRTSNLTVIFLKFTKYIYIYNIYEKFEEILFKLVQSKILFSTEIIEGVWFDDVGVEQWELG